VRGPWTADGVSSKAVLLKSQSQFSEFSRAFGIFKLRFSFLFFRVECENEVEENLNYCKVNFAFLFFFFFFFCSGLAGLYILKTRKKYIFVVRVNFF
jgi:hypothetical protein